MRNRECNCRERRIATNQRLNGQPVALWTCPVHGNVFEEKSSDIILTECQEDVLKTFSSEHKVGRPATADDVSRITNRTIVSVERAMAVLQALNFIERH